MKPNTLRYLSFLWAIVNCLCAGSITTFSLYGHLFQSRLHYTQFQVNTVSTAAEVAMYLPVVVMGYLCDRYGPGILSLFSGIFFGIGYLVAAFTYRSGPIPSADGGGWPFSVMVISFMVIGACTSCMYLAAVTTCAKNFRHGKYKGLTLAMPIAAFGISGVWQSQVGVRLLNERVPDDDRGDVDVFRYFLFLGITLLLAGLVGFTLLRIVDEDELIETAVDELECSGLLEDEEFFNPTARLHGYDTLTSQSHDLLDSRINSLNTSEPEELKSRAAEMKQKKEWLLNEETRLFLSDRTMWWLAAGFLFAIGSGETFINNMGSIIDSLTPPDDPSAQHTNAATHVSIVAFASTVARLLTGTLTDLFAPLTPYILNRRNSNPLSPSSSVSSLSPKPHKTITISRLFFFPIFGFFLALGYVLLASGFCQNHVSRFAAVSSLVGAGYGAIFSLVPIIVSVIWGVENFGTNWGLVVMMPAFGTLAYSMLYAVLYETAQKAGNLTSGEGAICYGSSCYMASFWIMAACVCVSCGMWLWAWRGPGGWKARGVVV